MSRRLSSPSHAGTRSPALAAVIAMLVVFPAMAAPVPAAFGLVVNTVPKGDAFLLLDSNEVWMAVDDFARAQVNTASLGGKRMTVDGVEYVLLSSLLPDVEHALSEKDGTLSLKVAPRLLPQHVIDLTNAVQTRPVLSPRPTSAFLNYAAQIRNLDVSTHVELGVNIRQAVLTSTASWAVGRVPVRGLTQLTYDDSDRMVRWILGDAYVASGALGGGAMFGGLHVSRQFGIDPYFVSAPRVEYANTASTPSTLEVYVNDALVRREEVPPGEFKLENVPTLRGLNGTRYVLRDAFGREREFRTAEYISEGLLAPGLVDFSLSLGARREDLALESFLYASPGGIGRFRWGISRWLTAGARFEAGTDRVSGGAGLTARLPLGELQLDAASSGHQLGTGFAAAAAYSVFVRHFSANVFARSMNPVYCTLGSSPTENRALFEWGGGVSTGLGRRSSVGIHAGGATRQDQSQTLRFSASGGFHVHPAVQLTVTVSAQKSSLTGLSYDGLLMTTFNLGTKGMGSVGVRHGSAGPSSTLELVKPVPSETGLGYRAQANLSGTPSGQLRGEYAGPFGRYAGGIEYASGRAYGSAEAFGALVLMDGEIHASRVIDNGFAVIRVPGASGVSVRLNNQHVGRTNARGTLLIPSLLPYYRNRISISDADLPEGFYVPGVEKTVAPSFRGGARVEFEARQVRAVRGRLVVRVGKERQVPAFGELQIEREEGNMSSPIGRAGEFELEDLAPGKYRARIVADAPCPLLLVVPPGEGVLEMGVWECPLP